MENALALIGATAVLVAIPGPNVALIVAQSVRGGVRFGLMTVAATTIGVGLQLALVVAGLSVLLDVAASALLWIKWLGVIYLVWLGVRTWRGRIAGTSDPAAPPTAAAALLQGLLLAVLNPKTLLFNAAFLPQFVATTADPGRELLLLAVVYLTVILVGDTIWALCAASVRRWLVKIDRWRDRLTGGLLLGAGLGLALARHDN